MVRILIIVVLLTTAQLAFAGPFVGTSTGGASGDLLDFVPIAPIPSEADGGLATSGDLGQYLNALFRLALAAGAALAAIYIAIGGFEYIFSEAMESKKNGRLRIVNALLGLAILLLVTIILFVIGGESAIDLNPFASAIGVLLT